MKGVGCTLCAGAAADAELGVTQVWEDRLWRLTMSATGHTTGFAFLEPKRHVPYITDLDGDEAATFGAVLARVTSALREAADTELVWVYIFGGGMPHLHVQLAPHREGDALNSQTVRGELAVERLPAEEIQRVIERATELLNRQ